MNTKNELFNYFNTMLLRMMEMNVSIESIYYTMYGDYMDKTALRVVINDDRLTEKNRERLIVLIVKNNEVSK